jgi:hypothetical protein
MLTRHNTFVFPLYLPLHQIKSLMAKTDIRDSNAGHDFHILWATRRLIELLKPSSKLTALKMEGVANEDLVGLSNADEHFLAADLTEYYGGRYFDEAEQTVISQLKYSTRHPQTAWTVARLCATQGKVGKTGKNKANSVIHRLAQSLLDLKQREGRTRDDIQSKALICLVSNQPLSAELQEMLKQIQAGFQKLGSAQIKLPRLLATIEAKHHESIKTLRKTISEFNEGEFTDLLRILDLSGCGADTRMGQHLAMMDEIAPSVPVGRHDALLRLKDLVRRQTLKDNPPLGQKDILAELDVSSLEELFPEPAAFQLPKKLVLTNESEKLLNILPISNQYVIAHGEAGVGKTTTVQQVQPLLPAGSVMVTYDCYAAGDYYNFSSGRHLLRRAVHQLSNELAVATGVPFLINVPEDPLALLDSFRKRLIAASKIVEAAGGLLIIAIDAADNSVIRGEQEPYYHSFVPYLWELTLPLNVRLLMTARTHRKSKLLKNVGRKPRVVELELSGFDLEASAIRFRQVFSGALQTSIDEFHARTAGNPRVQDYWLASGSHPIGSYAAFLQSFRRKGTTASEIIEDIVKAAIIEVTKPEQAQEQLSTLTCLKRPVPIVVFADACAISEADATIFCQALQPGLVLENGLITLRDEDFETQLRERPETKARTLATHHRLSDHFRLIAAIDDYAAQAVAEHFSSAKRYPELIELVLSDPTADIITDSVARLRTQRRRLVLAMQAASVLRDDIAGAKLCILAAESLRANAAVRALVHENVELAARFGATDSVMEHFHEDADRIWLGGVHYQLAAFYAPQLENQELAKDHLSQAYAWVKRHFRLQENGRSNWDVSDLDIACETETIYHLNGPQAAYKSISRWRPVRVRLSSLRKLLLRLKRTISGEQLEQELRSLQLPVLGECISLAVLWEDGYVASIEWITQVSDKLSIVLRRGLIKPVIREWITPYSETVDNALWPLHLAELLLHTHSGRELSIALITQLFPPFPAHSVSSYSSFASSLAPLRVAVLKAFLNNTDVSGKILTIVEKTGEKEKHRSEGSYEEQERRKHLDIFIDLLQYRYSSLNGLVSQSEALASISKGITELYKLRLSSDHESLSRQQQWLLIAGTTITLLENGETELNILFDKALDALGAKRARELHLQLTIVLLRSLRYQDLALIWLDKVAEGAENEALSLTERWQTLLRCAELSLPYDDTRSEDFYRRALNAAHQGIGDEIVPLLKVSTSVATRLHRTVSLEAGNAIASRLGALTEAYKPYVSDETVVPFEEALEAAAMLNPTTGVTLLMRWEDKDIFFIDKSIEALVQGLTKTGFWNAAYSTWLLKLSGDTGYFARPALMLLESMPVNGASDRQKLEEVLTEVAYTTERDAPLESKTKVLQLIVDWAKTRKLDNISAIKKISQTIAFVEALPHRNGGDLSASKVSHYETERAGKNEEWSKKAQSVDIEYFRKLADSERSLGEDIVPYLLQLGGNIRSNQRVDVLSLLTELHVYSGHRQHPTIEALKVLLTKWKAFGPVVEWARTGLPDFFSRRIYSIVGAHDLPSSIETFCQLPLSDSSRANLLLTGVYSNLAQLYPDQLCRIATALSATGNSAQQEEFAYWLLGRLENQLFSDGKELPYSSLLKYPEAELTAPELYAKFIWTALGNPDKRVRWHAVHAARTALVLSAGQVERAGVLAELMRLSCTTSSELLLVQEEFHWMSARTWVLVLFDRLAHEISADLVPHIGSLMYHVNNHNLPHAQIRELARRTVLTIHDREPGLLTAPENGNLFWKNQATECLPEKGIAESFMPEVIFKKQFDFDGIDTIPYWFEPLGELFGQDGERIKALVEHWICNQWDRTKQECEDSKSEERARYDFDLMHYYKMDRPTVETLETYLVHNALMCVAGQLVDSRPVKQDHYYDWDEWLEKFLPGPMHSTWIADWRGSTPLLPECWNYLPSPWKRKRTSDYVAALGLDAPSRQGWLCIQGNYHFGKEEKSGTSYLDSVMVPVELSDSLMWALQPVEGINYAFPTYGLHDSDYDLPEELPMGFEVYPLFQENKRNSSEGLQKYDTSKRSLRSDYPRLSEKVISSTGLQMIDFGKSYLDSDGQIAAEYEIWDDDLREVSRGGKYDYYSEGYRLWLRWDILQACLKKHNLDLLTLVNLKRSISSSNSYKNQESEYDYGKRRFAIFRNTGTIQTMAGDCKAWPSNR